MYVRTVIIYIYRYNKLREVCMMIVMSYNGTLILEIATGFLYYITKRFWTAEEPLIIISFIFICFFFLIFSLFHYNVVKVRRSCILLLIYIHDECI